MYTAVSTTCANQSATAASQKEKTFWHVLEYITEKVFAFNMNRRCCSFSVLRAVDLFCLSLGFSTVWKNIFSGCQQFLMYYVELSNYFFFFLYKFLVLLAIDWSCLRCFSPGLIIVLVVRCVVLSSWSSVFFIVLSVVKSGGLECVDIVASTEQKRNVVRLQYQRW